MEPGSRRPPLGRIVLTQSAIILGAGPGLGAALARRFAAAGFAVAAGARDGARVAALAADIIAAGGTALGVPVDASDGAAVKDFVARTERDLGPVEVAIHNPGISAPDTPLEDAVFARGIKNSVLDLAATDLEGAWRTICLGGMFLGREAARLMAARGHGTIIFTGATASVRGSALFARTAVAKAGLRALAQSMARELGPTGVHVTHVVIDGQIMAPRYRELAASRAPDALLDPAHIAEACLQLHYQPRSAWSHEIDLRPWVEPF